MVAAFLVMAIITSHLSDHARREALNARRSEKQLRDVIETVPAMAFSRGRIGEATTCFPASLDSRTSRIH
jgi:hypothetical protein